MTTTRVGTNIDSNSAGKSTSAITTVNVKDVVILWLGVNTASITADSLSSARITWSKLGTWAAPSPMSFQTSLFMGIVNSVGSDTITATFSGAIGSTLVQWTGTQFHTDTGLDWQVDNAQVTNGGTTSAVTTMTLPALTSTGTGRLGVGMMIPRFSGTNGATAGWTYPTADGFTDVWPYNLAVGSGAWTPATGTCTSGQYLSVGAILVPATAAVTGGGTSTTTTSVTAAARLAGVASSTTTTSTTAAARLAGVASPTTTTAVTATARVVGAATSTTTTSTTATARAVGKATSTTTTSTTAAGGVRAGGTSTTTTSVTAAARLAGVASSTTTTRTTARAHDLTPPAPPGPYRAGTPVLASGWRGTSPARQPVLAAGWRAGVPT